MWLYVEINPGNCVYSASKNAQNLTFYEFDQQNFKKEAILALMWKLQEFGATK